MRLRACSQEDPHFHEHYNNEIVVWPRSGKYLYWGSWLRPRSPASVLASSDPTETVYPCAGGACGSWGCTGYCTPCCTRGTGPGWGRTCHCDIGRCEHSDCDHSSSPARTPGTWAWAPLLLARDSLLQQQGVESGQRGEESRGEQGAMSWIICCCEFVTVSLLCKIIKLFEENYTIARLNLISYFIAFSWSITTAAIKLDWAHVLIKSNMLLAREEW